MVNLLIGFMIIPTFLGILLLVFWSIEFFKYILKVLKTHYSKKLNSVEIEQKEKSKTEVSMEPEIEVFDVDDEEIKK